MNEPSPPRIGVVLADDHGLVRRGIASLLARIPGVEVMADVGNGADLLAVLESLRPDVVLTDLSMPGMDGFTALERIRERFPQQRVLVLSGHETLDAVKRAVAAGACGYLRKDAPEMELALALQSVMRTGSYFSPALARGLLQPAETPQDRLTGRQLEILVLLAQGQSAKEIGHALGLSSKTVDMHRAHIMGRLGLNDVASLTRYAVREGLVEP